MRTLPADVATAIEPGDNVLLLCPSIASCDPGACSDILTVADAPRTCVLCVSIRQTAADRRAALERDEDVSFEEAAIVNVDASLRSSDSGRPEERGDGRSAISVDHVSSPTDLTTIGVRITDRLDEWTGAETDRRIVGCFDSVTTMLQYRSLDTTDRFLRILRERFSRAGAITHFHMDPDAHDPRTIRRIRDPFDVVCTFRDDAWEIRRR